jgi:hypothetical protein
MIFVRSEVFTAMTEECCLLECDAMWHGISSKKMAFFNDDLA